jgi:CBS domain-containing protein
MELNSSIGHQRVCGPVRVVRPRVQHLYYGSDLTDRARGQGATSTRWPADVREAHLSRARKNWRGDQRAVLASALAPGLRESPGNWKDNPDGEDVGIQEPFNFVSDVMTEVGLKATTAEATLESVVPLLENVSGLPVVDEDNKVVGVITRKVRSDLGNFKHTLRGGYRSLGEQARENENIPTLSLPVEFTILAR